MQLAYVLLGRLAAVALAFAPAASAWAIDAATPPATMKVGVSASISNVSVYAAIERGYFAERGLTVVPQGVASGSQAFPLLLNGQIAATATDPISALVAISKGIPIVIVAQGSAGLPTLETDPTGLVVRGDSQIRTGADFEGKTIAVNALSSLSQISAQAAIDALGGDSRKVKFVEVPVPNMIAAVERKQVDGAVTSEPFISQAKKAGLRVALHPPTQGTPGIPQLVFVTSRAYAASNPDVIRNFTAALTRANGFLAENPEEIRRIGLSSTKVPPEILKTMRLPVFSAEPFDIGKLKRLEQYMLKYGVLKAPLSLKAYAGQD